MGEKGLHGTTIDSHIVQIKFERRFLTPLEFFVESIYTPYCSYNIETTDKFG